MMYKLIFVILNQLYFLFLKDVYGQAFVPEPRVGQTATLVENRIYFIGGRNSALKPTNDVFYYDFESGLNSTGWADVQSQDMNLPTISWHAASRITFLNDRNNIFIIGGDGEVLSLVYEYNTEFNSLDASNIQGKIPPRRIEMSAVSYGRNIYIFGGRMINNGMTVFFNNFDILDTADSIWQVGSLVNAPPPRFLYTATLVNSVIYYIGGIEQNGLIQVYSPMTNIYQYDILGNTWSLKVATTIGNIPGLRAGHSAVYVEGKICIYGGRYKNKSMPSPIPSVEQIAILDTTTLTWSIPQLENTNIPKLDDANIPKLVFHSATIIDNLMFIAFGNLTDTQVLNDNYYVFDLSSNPNIQWSKLTADGTGNPKSPAIMTTEPKMQLPKPYNQGSPNKIVIISLSAVLAVIVLVVVILFTLIYRRMKKNQSVSDNQIPSDKNFLQHSPVNQQFTQTTSQYQCSPTSSLEQERISDHSSNYYPGSETP
ncbi:hypothetical protein RclHR1_09740008 [Rhizophagus clarus]|uniref:Galactose oxidase n=1 Tax=Rhizophagus clarus TaxID=94130 RepID=A0A2Z6SBA3_9GLOM|nr:hypothetical protein RclHR1_09740008 [Rhizophagus clarus]